MAGYDLDAAPAFGREVKPSSSTWRTGPPGVLTEAEFTARVGGGWLPAMHSHEQWREHQLRQAALEETDRQVAVEQRILREAADRGWDWVRTNHTGEAAKLAESVRARLGGSGTQLQESLGAALVAAGLRVQLQESTAVAPTVQNAGRLRVTLVTPGWGSSGHYSAPVLEAAGRDKIWPSGTQCFADHPTQRDLNDRPERSVRDLAAVLTSDARWDGVGLVAEAQLLPGWLDTLGKPEMSAAIGMSIRASAEVEVGEAEGRRGRIVTKIVEGQSVDFVTRAGRGGSYQVIESERPRWGW